MGNQDPKETSQASFIGGFELRVIDNYRFDEVTSAMQKMIRRSQEYEACYWAYVLHASGYYKYVWKRLMIIASEDVGSGNPMAPVVINALRQNYEATIDSKKRNSGDALLFVFHAVMYLSNSVKSREADNLTGLLQNDYNGGKRLEIPEVALDPHTARGKEIHGRWGHGTEEENAERTRKWHEEWAYLSPLSKQKDKYKALLLGKDDTDD